MNLCGRTSLIEMIKDSKSLPGLHSTSAFPINPGRQTQDIVLRGKLSITTHFAFLPHGSVSRQGFKHFPLKHASPLAHSESILHRGVIGGASKYIRLI